MFFSVLCFAFSCTKVHQIRNPTHDSCFFADHCLFSELVAESGAAVYINNVSIDFTMQFCQLYHCYSAIISESLRGGALFLNCRLAYIKNTCGENCYHFGSQFANMQSGVKGYFNDTAISRCSPVTDTTKRYHTNHFIFVDCVRNNITKNGVRGGNGCGLFYSNVENNVEVKYCTFAHNQGQEVFRLGYATVQMNSVNIISNLVISGAVEMGSIKHNVVENCIIIGNTCRVFYVTSGSVTLKYCFYSSVDSGVTIGPGCINVASTNTLIMSSIDCHTYADPTHQELRLRRNWGFLVLLFSFLMI